MSPPNSRDDAPANPPANPGGMDLADDLLSYVHASPSPYHAVTESIRRLEAHGYGRLDETQPWSLTAGQRFYVVRGGTSLAAFELGTKPVTESGFRLVGAHTDSPNLRVKPDPVVTRSGCHQLGVEIYGGVLLSTWLDRDLSIAGRVVTSAGPRLLGFDRPLLRVPNLAIHLNRTVNQEGLKLNAQEHMVPLVGLEALGPLDFKALLAEELGMTGDAVPPEDILAWDLSLHDVQPPTRSGLRRELIHAPRLDNLASCHAGLTALTAAKGREATCGAVLWDHEECGSRSAQGAASPFLRDLLERIAQAHGDGREDARHRAYQRSFLVSADMAHAVHPNYEGKHEPQHKPLLGQGPVIKSNVNQAYATDGESWARFEQLAREAKVPTQRFVTRSDLGCGSTIGPITAGQLGIRTVDVGGPMLSMHSIRELAAAEDVTSMIRVLERHYG